METKNLKAEDFQKLERVGKGAFGEVFKGINKRTGETVAIKTVDLEDAEDDLEDIEQEIKILLQCDSPYVTRVYGSFVQDMHLYIIMEFLSGGSVHDIMKALGPLEERYIAVIMREMLRGLDYLHSNAKIHRDIKAANILLSDQGAVKLADFGVCGQLSDTMTKRHTFVGTPFWMAPEVIKQTGYNERCDIWSLGITAIELAKSEPPYSEMHPMRVLFLIPKNPAPTLDGDYSSAFKEFIGACLHKDLRKRPSAKELLKHRFIKQAADSECLMDLVERKQAFLDAGGVISSSEDEDSDSDEFTDDSSDDDDDDDDDDTDDDDDDDDSFDGYDTVQGKDFADAFKQKLKNNDDDNEDDDDDNDSVNDETVKGVPDELKVKEETEEDDDFDGGSVRRQTGPLQKPPKVSKNDVEDSTAPKKKSGTVKQKKHQEKQADDSKIGEKTPSETTSKPKKPKGTVRGTRKMVPLPENVPVLSDVLLSTLKSLQGSSNEDLQPHIIALQQAFTKAENAQSGFCQNSMIQAVRSIPSCNSASLRSIVEETSTKSNSSSSSSSSSSNATTTTSSNATNSANTANESSPEVVDEDLGNATANYLLKRWKEKNAKSSTAFNF